MASSEEVEYERIVVEEFGEPEVMKVQKGQLKELEPKEGEVVVKILAVGVNPVDCYIRSGTYARKPALPYTPGTDAAGTIEKVFLSSSSSDSSDDKKFNVGDRVWLAGSVSGTYAQFALAKVSDVFLLPSSLSFAQGAALNIPYATAYRALYTRGGGKEGEVVLIHGASGGVGVAATQIAVAGKMRVLGTAGTEEGRELVKSLGAEAVFDHTSSSYIEQIKQHLLETSASNPAFASQTAVDLVVEMIANVNLQNDLTLLSKHGRVLIVGSRGPIEINPRNIMAVEADVRGVALALTSPQERLTAFAAINAGLADGSLRPIADHGALPLASAAQGHRDILTTRRIGKLILDPWATASL